MKNIIFSTESACDIPQEFIEKYDLRIAPMTFYINGVEFSSDDNKFSPEQIGKLMEEGATTSTTQINQYEAKEFLEKLLTEGKDVIHFSFSSGMSNTYNNFKLASDELNKTHTNKVYVIDTLCQSGGVGVLIKITADEMENHNLSFEDTIQFAEDNKKNIAHIFTVEDLKYLSRGGRISATTAIIGNILKIKPVLNVNNDGVIVTAQKVISRKRAITTIAEKMAVHYSGKFDTVIISEASCHSEAEFLANCIKEKLGITPYIVPLNFVVEAHGGPGSLALFFHAFDRKY